MIMNVPTVEEVEDLHESVEIVEEGEVSREEVVVIEYSLVGWGVYEWIGV